MNLIVPSNSHSTYKENMPTNSLTFLHESALKQLFIIKKLTECMYFFAGGRTTVQQNGEETQR